MARQPVRSLGAGGGLPCGQILDALGANAEFHKMNGHGSLLTQYLARPQRREKGRGGPGRDNPVCCRRDPAGVR
ncbi:hypothetical protein GCM10023209_01740 [Roseibacterium beibuensis]|uniref:Uncharacterized protein n=1 Tax=[Roseibacterium] beibuensis TaxID=1193142 RepID=A0ABP9KVW4_9RHOB